MAFAVGDRRGPYQIISAIGKRGMGEVRKAMIRVARRYVAISYPCGRYEVISVGIRSLHHGECSVCDQDFA